MVKEKHLTNWAADCFLAFKTLANMSWRSVKNGFSDLTKEQKGQDQPRKDIVNRHQVRALREGCHERMKARVGVSSREKKNTNRTLARATTKSKSRTQTVSNGHVG